MSTARKFHCAVAASATVVPTLLGSQIYRKTCADRRKPGNTEGENHRFKARMRGRTTSIGRMWCKCIHYGSLDTGNLLKWSAQSGGSVLEVEMT
ncbi:hypothetical protein BD769DRAFT_1518121 [Suillus cothurnatus]|nr:hypothetical protein BD769DRAFT_1518121 [Suillus cothurnatus]